MKKTPFYEKHLMLHAKMVDFAGFKMPMFYNGIVPEHMIVRDSVGLFDISHMGEFMVRGENAGNWINSMVTNDVSNLSTHKVLYTAMCYENGSIIDDLLVYRLPGGDWMLVVNGSNIDKDWEWLVSNKPEDIEMVNKSDDTALLALQGPNAEKTLQKLTKSNLSTLPYYTSATISLNGIRMLVSRTGYTGEDGFEIYHKPADASKLWDLIMDAGHEFEIEPIGLGARDSLRLEMKFCLYGNDINETTNPIEAGLSWVVKLETDDFMGKQAIVDAKANLTRRLVCIEARERCFPRDGYELTRNGEIIGKITSGIYSPSMQRGIALAYINRPYTKSGTDLGIKIRDRVISAQVVKPPFYKNGTVRSGK